jgi:hypothetical protein
MPTLGEQAMECARAELQAVQAAAFGLAVLVARFRQEAERIAALLDELETTD